MIFVVLFVETRVGHHHVGSPVDARQVALALGCRHRRPDVLAQVALEMRTSTRNVEVASFYREQNVVIQVPADDCSDGLLCPFDDPDVTVSEVRFTTASNTLSESGRESVSQIHKRSQLSEQIYGTRT